MRISDWSSDVCSSDLWDSQETSLDFARPDWHSDRGLARLSDVVANRFAHWQELASETVRTEEELNDLVSSSYRLDGEISRSVGRERVSLINNPYFRFDNVEGHARADRKSTRLNSSH